LRLPATELKTIANKCAMLHKIFTVFFLLLTMFALHAQQSDKMPASKWEGYNPPGCIESGIAVWPYNDTIYPNSFIFIQCAGTHQQIIKSIGTNYSIYLKQGADTLPLLVQDITDGQSNITGVLLKPAKPLVSGKDYILHIDNDSIRRQVYPDEGFMTKDFDSKPSEHDIYVHEKKWYVADGQADTTPIWQQKPVELSRSSGMPQGTSNTINFAMRAVTFGYKLQNTNDVILKVQLTNTTTQTEAILYITPTDSTFTIGRDNTCFGNFLLDKNSNYKAAFNVLDKFGKEYKWKGKEISFVSPD
jgi:hypothetical protein